MMLRGRGFLCLLLLGCLLHAGAAYGAPGDPEAGSPSGSVYELPLDSARSDAAPGGGGTTAPAPASPDSGAGGGSTAEGEGGEGGEGTSYYRSENNFGSSSEVPGTAKADNGPSGDGGGGGGAGGGSGGGAASSDLTAQNTSAPVDTGNTSVAGTLALLAAIAALAAGLGALAMRRRSRTR